jgi:hypothetical protein
MKKFILGILIGGLLLSGGWFAWAAVQTEVGINGWATVPSVDGWKRLRSEDITTNGTFTINTADDFALFTISQLYAYDAGSTSTLSSIGSEDMGTNPITNSGANALWTSSFLYGRDVASSEWDAISSKAPADGFSQQGAWVSTWSSEAKWNGTTYDRGTGIDATTLTETVSTGATLVAPLSTWSVTHTPAAATVATISKAAGGASVRHVATTITACFSGAAVSIPVQVTLRDGATGAGTVLRTWLIGVSVINGSTCVDLSGLGMIGTANTAMTLEFSAAGAADTNQTVTLTGYTVS